MKKCAIYVRVSTALGKQDYTRQISELTEIAKRDGYTDENIIQYADTISGYKFEERDELNNLLNEIRENPKLYECIYISEISRLGRKPRNTRNIIEELIDLKVPIYVQSLNQRTIDEKGERNGYISVSLQLMLEIADMEAATFKLRSRSGRIQKVKEGKLDFGYNARTDKYENMIAAGVIDPTKVSRIALENAASIAAMLLTTECVLADDPEDDKGSPSMGGAPGMGGMGGMM